MTAPPAILVAVPAHDEQSSVVTCVRAVLAAVRVALDAGQIRSATIGVAAHRCTDRTAARASAVLEFSTLPDHVTGVVARDEIPSRVGAVRARLIDRLAALPGPSTDWVLSTDADSIVPENWVTDLMRIGASRGADALAGPVELVGWHGSQEALQRYRAIVAAGMTSDGHRHVYAANLAVRMAAYRAVGGFREVEHGEEHALLNDLRAASFRVVSVLRPVVQTSSRLRGRAPGGLADLLRSLHEDQRLGASSGTAS